MSTVVQTVAAGVVLVVVAACTGSAGAPAEAADPAPSETVTATAEVPAVVNGPITSAQRHFRTPVNGYNWLAFGGAADRGLFASYVRCADCLPSKGRVRRLIVLGPSGRVATLACPDGQRCPLGDSGSAATLGPGADAVTVEWGHGKLAVIGYDGTVRRRLDVTAALAHGDDVMSLAWSPDGTRIAARVKYGVVEISAEDGRVLARHPHSRRTSGWLIWTRKDH